MDNKNLMKRTNTATVFISFFLFSIVSSLIIFAIFGFEIAIIFIACLGPAFLLAGFSGVENILLLINEENKHLD